jgi:hypothetical protein
MYFTISTSYTSPTNERLSKTTAVIIPRMMRQVVGRQLSEVDVG